MELGKDLCGQGCAELVGLSDADDLTFGVLGEPRRGVLRAGEVVHLVAE